MPLPADLTQFLASVHPYDSLPDAALDDLAQIARARDLAKDETVFAVGEEVRNLYVIAEGEIEITDETGVQLSILGPRNSFGERALLRGAAASRTATVQARARMICIPAAKFFGLIETHAPVARFFDRRRPERAGDKNVATLPVERLMTRDPITCAPDTPIRDAARQMHEHRISSVCVCDGDTFRGIVTLRDMNGRVIVGGADASGPVSGIMTEAPLTLDPKALVTDVLHLMVERGIGHVPIVERDRLRGIVTQTDLTRAQAMSSADIVGSVAKADTADEMGRATAQIPKLLLQLVETGNRHEVVTRLITDIADTATRRLLTLAEARLGPAPVPYLWLACGSQGRQEQTGVSDQDNCLILSDDVTDADMPYFAELAKFVSDGLDRCGYYYCPGDMMATNPRWCQPLRVWRDYFQGWIAKPDPEAQMLASVMFDLRPIGGDESLFEGLQTETLKAAARNSIFTAHMVSNSLKHQPPLGLLRGLATIRSGEHRNQLDLKHNGVVPVVDLGRVYTLQGQLRQVNTRARIEAAIESGTVSKSGGADLLDAYDLIATMRLDHQAAQVRAGGSPSNYLDPSDLSDFERSHLRDAFVVVKTMQSAAGSGKGAIG
ncbi:MAG: CBS domain-containing protein [Alphaproteobacteria bacterium]|jgi:CBS domain-containing protein|nr:CBS domain-containing protein [Alphaproteobacteria bacterium]